MPRIAVIYFSATGHTTALVEALRVGAREFADVELCEITGADIVSGRFENESILGIADNADGIVFGCPTYMGGPAAQFKAFADASSDRWSTQKWAGKIAAGLTTGACPNGDQTNTLVYFTILAAQHGMLWCSLDIPGGEDPLGRNRLGSQLGIVSQPIDGVLPTADLETARHLGARLARTVTKLCQP